MLPQMMHKKKKLLGDSSAPPEYAALMKKLQDIRNATAPKESHSKSEDSWEDSSDESPEFWT